jgi:hypothetical protein
MTRQFILEYPCDEAVALITGALAACGLRVLRTFDLHVAANGVTRAAGVGEQHITGLDPLRTPLATPVSCVCSKHGTADCDCQMVVMLMYGAAASPATLVVHGHDGRTWVSLVDVPGQRPDPDLATVIFQSLCRVNTSQIYWGENLRHESHEASRIG